MFNRKINQSTYSEDCAKQFLKCQHSQVDISINIELNFKY